MKRRWIIIPLAVVVSIAGYAGFHFLESAVHTGGASAEPVMRGARESVVLTPEKFEAAGISVEPATTRELGPQRTVPGRLDYNGTRHVQVKSPFNGLIRRIDVKVGDRVIEGQVMAVVDSPDLGERRADVFQRVTDLQQATNEHDWWHSVQANVDELVARLKESQESLLADKDAAEKIEKDFADKPLGDYRQQVLGAYSRMCLDAQLSTNIKSAAASGAVAGRAKLELDTARDTSRAKFLAVCEQATFDVKQTHIKAESAMNDAERRLAVARQRLDLFVGQAHDEPVDSTSEEMLSTWPVKAPFTATVEQVLFAPRERIQMGEGLLQIADASRLWVHADIREKDWSALTITQGQEISVQTPALKGKTLDATVAFVGRTVAPETRAVPLTADIDNQAGLLRPGMFVRVLLPDGKPRECLAVPHSAIAANEGRTFVFVETGEREYRPRDVKTGLSVEPWIEIVSGLVAGDKVVTKGTAILKAELLLEPED